MIKQGVIEKIKLVIIDKKLAEILHAEILDIIKKAEDDLMLEFDMYAYEKAAAKIVGLMDNLLATDTETQVSISKQMI